MSRLPLILLGVAIVALIYAFWNDEHLQEKAGESSGSAERHAFLQGRDLSGGGHALLLYPLATGEGPRAVVDTDALRAAQETAYFTNKTDAEFKRILPSIAFLSPPTSPTSHHFVSVVKDKTVEEEFKCYAAYCNGTLEIDPPHERDLAGLLEASVPVEQVVETYPHHDKARAAHFRHFRDPQVVQIDPPNLPAPGTVDYPHRVILTLPAILRDTDETGRAPHEPFDEANLEARFQAAFTHAYPKTGEYRLGEMRVTTYYPPETGWPIVSDELDGDLLREDGTHIGLDRIMVIEPRVAIDLHGAMNTALTAPDAFAEMPEFLPLEPKSVATRLNAMAEDHLGRPCPDCFKIELPVTTVGDIHVRSTKPIPYTLSYYRIVPE